MAAYLLPYLNNKQTSDSSLVQSANHILFVSSVLSWNSTDALETLSYIFI